MLYALFLPASWFISNLWFFLHQDELNTTHARLASKISFFISLFCAMLWRSSGDYQLVYAGIFLTAMVICVIYDFYERTLPIHCTLLLGASLIVSYFLLPISITWEQALLGAGLGFGLLWSINKIYAWRTGHDGLGAGDCDLALVIGAFFGPDQLGFILTLGAAICVLYALWLKFKNQNDVLLPFGGCLALAAIITWMINATALA